MRPHRAFCADPLRARRVTSLQAPKSPPPLVGIATMEPACARARRRCAYPGRGWRSPNAKQPQREHRLGSARGDQAEHEPVRTRTRLTTQRQIELHAARECRAGLRPRIGRQPTDGRFPLGLRRPLSAACRIRDPLWKRSTSSCQTSGSNWTATSSRPPRAPVGSDQPSPSDGRFPNSSLNSSGVTGRVS
jgi:hypothetical protein